MGDPDALSTITESVGSLTNARVVAVVGQVWGLTDQSALECREAVADYLLGNPAALADMIGSVFPRSMGVMHPSQLGSTALSRVNDRLTLLEHFMVGLLPRHAE